MIKLHGRQLDQQELTSLLMKEKTHDYIVGFLVNGVFMCSLCLSYLEQGWNFEGKNHSMKTKVYLSGVLPYSQECWICKELIVDAAKKSIDNSPLNAFSFTLS